MKLHWSPRSPYVRFAMATAHEKGLVEQLEIVRTIVGPFHVTPGIYPDNPAGKIPTLVLDDGTELFDSRVIAAYFDWISDSGPNLYPAEELPRFDTLRREALGINLIDHFVTLLIERWKPEGGPIAALVDAETEKIDHALAGIAALVSNRNADAFDAGDLAMTVALTYADFRFADTGWRQKQPGLSDWFDLRAERPSIRATAFTDDR